MVSVRMTVRITAFLAILSIASAFTNGTDLQCWCGDYTATCALPACATGADVTIDFGAFIGEATQRGSGILHSLFRNVPGDPLLPADDYVLPLRVRNYRGREALPLYAELKAAGVRNVQVVFSDYFGYDCSAATPDSINWNASSGTCSAWPGDGGNWSRFDALIDDVFAHMQAAAAAAGANASDFHWDVWNEPDRFTYWNRSEAQYFDMWTRAARRIRALDANAVVVGPCLGRSYPRSQYNAYVNPTTNSSMRRFLEMAEARGVMPDVVSWHEWSPHGAAIAPHVADMRAYLAGRGAAVASAVRGFSISESIPPDGIIRPATNLAYFVAAERAGSDVTLIKTNYGFGPIDGEVTYVNGDACKPPFAGQKRAVWHSHAAYAAVGPTLVRAAAADADAVAFAGFDAEAAAGQIVVGYFGDQVLRSNALQSPVPFVVRAERLPPALVGPGGCVAVTVLLIEDDTEGTGGPSPVSECTRAHPPPTKFQFNTTVDTLEANNTLVFQLPQMNWEDVVSVVLEKCLFFSSALASQASLSPAEWPPGMLEKYTADNSVNCDPSCDHPLVEANMTQGIVGGTSNVLAVAAGARALEIGGNAIDAALATMLAQATLAGTAYVSYHGTTSIHIYNASTNTSSVVTALWGVPEHLNVSAVPPVQPPTTGPDGSAVLVPGMLAGVERARQLGGTLGLATLLEPSRYFAREGVPMPDLIAVLLRLNANNPATLGRPGGGGIAKFTNPATGQLYQADENWTQPELASFLDAVAEHGIGHVYGGAWAEKVVEKANANGGNLTVADFARYPSLVQVTEARSAPWQAGDGSTRFDLRSGGQASAGLSVIEVGNLMQAAGFTNSAYQNNGTALFWLTQFSRWSSFVTDNGLAFPKWLPSLGSQLGLNVTFENRASIDFARRLWRVFSAPGGVQRVNRAIGFSSNQLGIGKHSDGVVAIDRFGNAVSAYHTINADPWGTGLFVDGVALSNAGSVNRLKLPNTSPGEMLPDSVNPTLALVDGHVAAGWVSVGGGLDYVMSQLLTRLLGQRQTPDDAIEGALFVDYQLTNNNTPCQRVLENSFSAHVLDAATALGQEYCSVPLQEYLSYYGVPVGFVVRPDGTSASCDSVQFLNGGCVAAR